MRFIFLILLFALPAKAEVTYVTTAAFERPSLLSLAEMQSTMEQKGYWIVDLKNTGKLTSLGVDQVFVSSDFSEKIFLKYGVVPKPFQTWIELDSGFVFHGKTPDDIPYALYFEGFSKEKSRKLTEDFRSVKTASAWTPLISLLIPKASASAPCAAMATLSGVSAVAAASASAMSGILDFQTLATCATSALQGAASTVTGPLEALRSLVRNPRAFWANASAQFAEMRRFITHLQSEMQNFIRVIGQGIDREILAQIGCGLAGEVIASVGITALTAGTSAWLTARLAANTVRILARLTRMREMLVGLSRARRTGAVASTGPIIKGIMACAVH